MNRSAIQPEPSIPHRKICASAAGSIRDAGNDIGNDIECLKLNGGCYRLCAHPYVNLIALLTRIILASLAAIQTAALELPSRAESRDYQFIHGVG